MSAEREQPPEGAEEWMENQGRDEMLSRVMQIIREEEDDASLNYRETVHAVDILVRPHLLARGIVDQEGQVTKHGHFVLVELREFLRRLTYEPRD